MENTKRITVDIKKSTWQALKKQQYEMRQTHPFYTLSALIREILEKSVPHEEDATKRNG